MGCSLLKTQGILHQPSPSTHLPPHTCLPPSTHPHLATQLQGRAQGHAQPDAQGRFPLGTQGKDSHSRCGPQPLAITIHDTLSIRELQWDFQQYVYVGCERKPCVQPPIAVDHHDLQSKYTSLDLHPSSHNLHRRSTPRSSSTWCRWTETSWPQPSPNQTHFPGNVSFPHT